jgi:polyribonucleotide nucleotidyltransferase
VKVISVNREGKTRLTLRELLPFPEGEEGDRARERIQKARDAGPPQRGGGGGRGGGGRDRDRGPRRDRGDDRRPR